jgi:nucleotide-binding universal stress UspA family protein
MSKHFKRILITVDDSAHSFRAAEQGIELGRALKAEVAFLFVVDRALALGNIDAGIMPEQALVKLKIEAMQTIDQLIEMYRGDLHIVHFTPIGLPKEEILNTAKEWQADLIVMGTHGRTGLLHLVMGSVAEHIVRHATVPVLVVR